MGGGEVRRVRVRGGWSRSSPRPWVGMGPSAFEGPGGDVYVRLRPTSQFIREVDRLSPARPPRPGGLMSDDSIDAETAHSARIYDYILGGSTRPGGCRCGCAPCRRPGSSSPVWTSPS